MTIYTPANSSMEAFANQNDIPLLGEVQANGGSIRVTDAGLRFGYQYNGKENKNIEEYGFLYSYDGSDDFDINTDGIKKKAADKKRDNGDSIEYNLVFTSVPKSAYDQLVSARAYIKIGGEYFYSDITTRSYNQIANAVLADVEIDENTKTNVRNLLHKEV